MNPTGLMRSGFAALAIISVTSATAPILLSHSALARSVHEHGSHDKSKHDSSRHGKERDSRS